MASPLGKLFGLARMEQKIRQYRVEFPDRVRQGLYQEALIELTEMKKRTPVSPVPAPRGVVPGTLRASGAVAFPQRLGKRVWVEITFGGAASAYALIQHEELDFFHTTGQARYVASVLEESAPFMAKRVADRIRR